ncbi:MAG: amidase [Planctomycetota bacterium]|nr:amidase [Planctomycetota bacterium]
MMILGLMMALHSPLDAQAGGGAAADEPATSDEVKKELAIDEQALRHALAVAGLQFTDAELVQMLPAALDRLHGYAAMSARPIENSVAPAFIFRPLEMPWVATVAQLEAGEALPQVKRPDNLQQLLWAEIPVLASLIQSRQVSCEELTLLFLGRLREVDAVLHCVISYTEDRALVQAKALDEELAAGKWRGPLHGIPYGVKDLCSVKGTKTSWGATPYKDQVIEVDATVVKKLDAAGAVLLAKTTLGALAMGDVWYGGKTLSPWNQERGSSGSSAGSAAAVGAGALPFAIGSETLGSIISPSTRCGNSSLRPTAGRVSRYGAMALSWTMDKLGPICRSLQDTALVLDAIEGADGLDLDGVDRPFEVPGPMSIRGWKIGYSPVAFERADDHRIVLEELKELGAELVAVELPDYPVWPMMTILFAESACAFDDLTRSDRDDELVEQGPEAWPNSFRAARLIPAVEYIRAQRLRTLLMRDTASVLSGVDAYLAPAGDFKALAVTNLTGHPSLVAPCGFKENQMPRAITFIGHPYDEARLVTLGSAWQRSTAYHLKRPTLAVEDRDGSAASHGAKD